MTLEELHALARAEASARADLAAAEISAREAEEAKLAAWEHQQAASRALRAAFDQIVADATEETP